MYVHQNKNGVTYVWLKNECANEDDKLIYIYDYTDKVFLRTEKSPKPLLVMFAELLKSGTRSKEYKAACVVQDFLRLHQDFMSTVDPKFKDNEIAVKVGRSNTGRIYTTVRVIGSAVDIRRYVACGTDGEKVEELSISHRVEVVNTGEVMDASEAVLIKLEDLESHKSEDRIFAALRKEIKRMGTGSMGAILIWKDIAYRF